MVIFHSYVSLSEGKMFFPKLTLNTISKSPIYIMEPGAQVDLGVS